MKTYHQAAQASKTIKALLKKHYPTINFSVRSNQFAGGDSVRIDWNMGPTTDEVDKLVKDFQYGNFDGMNDIYEYSNVKDMPQAKYVQCQREYKSQLEIDTNKKQAKMSWRDPAYIDLWNEKKTLHHDIARDICKAMGIEYEGDYTRVPEDYLWLVRGVCTPTIGDLIYQICYKTSFMNGYHGVKREMASDGVHEITNSIVLW